MKLYEDCTVATYELNKHDHNSGLSCLVFLKATKMVFSVEYFAHFNGVLLVWEPCMPDVLAPIYYTPLSFPLNSRVPDLSKDKSLS